jgi:peptidoglycan/LPS O-acetylase OafA/YrhL
LRGVGKFAGDPCPDAILGTGKDQTEAYLRRTCGTETVQNTETSLTTGRVWSFEYLRILAAFAVVWFHAGARPFHWPAASGVYVFLLISLVLLAWPPPKKPLAAFASGKFRRVMVPWMFWSLLYLLLGLARSWRHGTPFYEPWMLWTGFSLHLWFLPYLFCASVALYWMRQGRPFFDGPTGFASLAAVGLVLLAANGVLRPETPPLSQWMVAVPVTLLGFALGRIMLVRDVLSRRLAVFALFAGVFAVCIARICIPGLHTNDDTMVLCGFGAFVALAWLPLPPSAAVGALAPLTLGIYLMHPFGKVMLDSLLGESSSPLRVVMIFSACALAVYVLRKIPFMREVV